MDKDKIQQGKNITRKFEGGIFEELRYLRQSIWALYILTQKTKPSKKDKDKADKIVKEMLDKNDQIEGWITKKSKK